jgi:hypothetical protein
MRSASSAPQFSFLRYIDCCMVARGVFPSIADRRLKLRRLGCRRLSVWLRHPQQDLAAQETHYRSGQSRDPRARSRKSKSNSGGFTLSRRGVGRQAQTSAVRATAATKRNDVARITLRRRQTGGDELIFSDRRDRIRDMVRFLHCYSGRHVVLVAMNMGIACLRRNAGRMKLWKGSCGGTTVGSDHRYCPHIVTYQTFRP